MLELFIHKLGIQCWSKQKSLHAKLNSTPSAVRQSPPVFQVIKGSSTVKDVWFTWLIITSDNEVSVNLRYVGDGSTTPPLSIAAAALTKEGTRLMQIHILTEIL